MQEVFFMGCLVLSFFGLPGPFGLSSSSWLDELMLTVTLLSVAFGSATGSLSIEASFSAVSEDSDVSEPAPIASSSSTTFFSCPLFLSRSQLSTSSDTYLRCETFSHVDSLSGQPCHLTLQSTFFPITFLPMMRSTTQRSYAIWLACMRKDYRPNECYKAFIKQSNMSGKGVLEIFGEMFLLAAFSLLLGFGEGWSEGLTVGMSEEDVRFVLVLHASLPAYHDCLVSDEVHVGVGLRIVGQHLVRRSLNVLYDFLTRYSLMLRIDYRIRAFFVEHLDVALLGRSESGHPEESIFVTFAGVCTLVVVLQLVGLFLSILRDRVVVVLVDCVYDVLQDWRALPFCMLFPLVSVDRRWCCLAPAGRILGTMIDWIFAPEGGTFELSISTSGLLLDALWVSLG